MRLSQAQLKVLETCPRQFQHKYLDQFDSPLTIEAAIRMQQGSQFHLLMQQWGLGLPIEPLLEGDPQLQKWFEQFQRQSGEILQLGEPVLWQQSEQMRTIKFGDHVLTVVYDWVLIGQTQGKILDWKTYPKPRQIKWLQQDWQTKLYLYVLAETSGLAAEHLSMCYWFFQIDESEAQSLSVGYGSAQHEVIRADLQGLCDRLTRWLADYQDRAISFPQVGELKVCEGCGFVARCGRGEQPEALEGLAWEAIEEVAL
jgi:hypothetical protein